MVTMSDRHADSCTRDGRRIIYHTGDALATPAGYQKLVGVLQHHYDGQRYVFLCVRPFKATGRFDGILGLREYELSIQEEVIGVHCLLSPPEFFLRVSALDHYYLHCHWRIDAM